MEGVPFECPKDVALRTSPSSLVLLVLSLALWLGCALVDLVHPVVDWRALTGASFVEACHQPTQAILFIEIQSSSIIYRHGIASLAFVILHRITDPRAHLSEVPSVVSSLPPQVLHVAGIE